MRFKIVSAMALFLSAFIFHPAYSLPKQLDIEHSITVDGRERTYRLFVPDNYSGTSPVPLLLVFHGGGSESRRIAEYSRFYELAQKYGFIAAYPQGVDRGWHGMRGAADRGSDEAGPIDDLAFIRSLVNRLESEYDIDAKRIYSTGMSAGGIFSYFLACRMADTFAGIAVVSGTMVTSDCEPSAPVAVFHVHAKMDENVPFEGGQGRLTARQNNWPPVSKGLDFWRKENGCESDEDQSDTGPEAVCRSDNVCSSNKPVAYCLVEGGHQWPGLPRRAVWQMLTGTEISTTFPASDRIWAFLKSVAK